MESETLYSGKWLMLKSVQVQTKSGEFAQWEYVERPHRSSMSDGVDIIATFNNKLICEAVFRYPVDQFVLEFPAGLSEGLGPSECALKELKEETGYIAYPENIVHVSPVLCCDPWKSTETTTLVCIEVPNIEENQHPVQNLEDEELIIVELIDLDNLLENLQELAQRKNYLISAKLYLLAQGIHDSKNR